MSVTKSRNGPPSQEEAPAELVPQLRVLGLTPEQAASLRAFAEAGVSEATRRAYAGTWRAWLAWCASSGAVPLRFEPAAVAAWLAELAAAGRRPSTVARHLAALSTLARVRGVAAPSEDPAVAIVLRGIRRKGASQQKRQARPLELAELAIGIPRGSDLRSLRDRALLLVGWAAALRRAELVGLTWDRLEERPEGFLLFLGASKGDQDGEGAILGIPRARSAERCPCLAALAWRAACGGPVDGPVFRHVDRHGRILGGLTAGSVNGIVRAAAERAGLDPCGFSGHSLRAGFVTSAVRAGIPEREICLQTRHRTLVTLRLYARLGTVWLDNAATRLL